MDILVHVALGLRRSAMCIKLDENAVELDEQVREVNCAIYGLRE